MSAVVSMVWIALVAHAASADHCASSPCANGVCKDTGNSYACSCHANFVGHRCFKDFNDCQYNSCVHGACEDHVGGFSCMCKSGWEGPDCDKNADDCGPLGCLNGGSCIDKINGYECRCLPNFTGENCESPIEDLTDFYISVDTSSGSSGRPELAVDNEFDVGHSPASSCARAGGTNPWWSVTLDKVYPIQHVKVYVRYGWGNRLSNLLVTVDGQRCATYGTASSGNTLLHMYCPEGTQGQTVKLEKSGDTVLTLCEVQLFGHISKDNLNF